MKARSKNILLAALLAAALPLAAAAPDMAALFPELKGWTRDGDVRTFRPDNLYEHINGAAESFLACGFELLAVQNYVNESRQALTAEIYFHGTPENAFAIYSSEKPLQGDYLALGSEGYIEEGVLNFISDAYYVKLNGFDLGEAGADALRHLGERIAQAVNGGNALPAALAAFPVRGKIAHSERYFLDNFLGHDFLGAAFSADYEVNGRRFKLFIMNSAGADKARARLQRWARLDKEGAATEIRPGNLVINDPYNGPVRVSMQGELVWGGLGQGEEMAALIKDLGTNLMEKQKK
jgi:hypothetical protein